MAIADALDVPKVVISPVGALGSFPGTLLNTPSAPTLTPQFPKWVPQPIGFLDRVLNLGYWCLWTILQHQIWVPAYSFAW